MNLSIILSRAINRRVRENVLYRLKTDKSRPGSKHLLTVHIGISQILNGREVLLVLL